MRPALLLLALLFFNCSSHDHSGGETVGKNDSLLTDPKTGHCNTEYNVATYRCSAAVQPSDSISFVKMKAEFQNNFPGFKKMNPDSLKKVCINKHPHIFSTRDTCLRVKSLTGEELKICTISNKRDAKGYQSYKYLSLYCNKVILVVEGYEYGYYVVIDLQTGVGVEMPGPPKFYNEEFIYSIDDYYNEVSLVNMVQARGIKLSYQYQIKEVIGLNDAVAIKAACGNETLYWIVSLR